MVARITVDRILRDEDDASGQTIRDWKIEAEGEHLTIRMKHGDGFILLRFEDINLFVADLNSAAKAASSLAKEP